MGKSLYIRRMSEKLRKLKPTGELIVTVPIHGPDISPDVIMNILSNHLDEPCAIVHFDISPSVSYINITTVVVFICKFLHLQIFSEVGNILFSLVILKGITDSQGKIWRAHPSQLLAVEVTIPAVQVSITITEQATLPL